MAKPRFLIKLKNVHEQHGLSPYAVAKKLDLNQNTVRKYLTEDVETDELLSHVLMLIDFFDLDWKDPAVIEVIEAEEDDTKEFKAPLAVPA